MFFTFYELSTDATIFEMLIWFALHGMLQILGVLALVMLLIFAAAEQVFAFFHGRKSDTYRHNASWFAKATMLLCFSFMGIYVGATYWSMLPAENQHVGWFVSLPVILACLFFTWLAVNIMTTTWKKQCSNEAEFF